MHVNSKKRRFESVSAGLQLLRSLSVSTSLHIFISSSIFDFVMLSSQIKDLILSFCSFLKFGIFLICAYMVLNMVCAYFLFMVVGSFHFMKI